MEKKHWILTVVAVTLIIALGSWYIINKAEKSTQLNGIFTFELIDKDSNKLIDEQIEFDNDDRLIDIMIERYNVKYEVTEYGTWIQDINDVIGNSSYYLALYIDNSYSMVGIDDISLNDGMVVTWIVTAF